VKSRPGPQDQAFFFAEFRYPSVQPFLIRATIKQHSLNYRIFIFANPAEPEPKMKLITKASRRGWKNTKKRQIKFRVFEISCFRDENIFS
jgi:hypothetical protein